MSTGPNRHKLYGRYLEVGAEAAGTRDEAMALVELLRDEPAHNDPKHRGHKIVKADIKTLYDKFVPDQPDADQVLPGGTWL